MRLQSGLYRQAVRLVFAATLALPALHCDNIQDIPDVLLPLSAAGNRPGVIASSPPLGAQTIAQGDPIYVEFDRDMNLETTRNTLFLTGSGASSGSPRWAGRRLYFDLEEPLTNGATYTLRVDGGATSADGVRMEVEYLVFFTVGSRLDAPRVLNTTPINNAQGILPTSAITVVFSRPMNRTSVEAAFSISPSAPGAFAWNSDDSGFTYTPFGPLSNATTYSVGISASAADTEGITFASSFNLSFQVGSDFTGPLVLNARESGAVVNLVDGQAGIYKDSAFIVNFNEGMRFSQSQNAFSITRLDTNSVVSGQIAWNPTFTQLTFTPNDPLEPETLYRLRVTTGAQDLAGNALDTEFTRAFTVNNTAGAQNSNYLAATVAQKSSPSGAEALSLVPGATTNVTMAGSASGTPVDAVFRFQFSRGLMRGSAPENVSVQRLFGIYSDSAAVSGVAFETVGFTDDRLVLFVGGLAANTYKITVFGGRNGLKSRVIGAETSTWLEEDLVFFVKVNP